MKKILGLSITLFISLYLVACSVTDNSPVADNQTISNQQSVEINHQHSHPEMSSTINQPTKIEIAKITPRKNPKAQIDVRSFEPRSPVKTSTKLATKLATKSWAKPNPTRPIKKTVVTKHYPRSRAVTKKKPRRTVLTNKQRFSGVLEAHNGVRKKHGLQALTWSDKLARYSKQWTDHLGSGSHCQIRHRGGTPPYGENLYRASALRWSTGEREILPITIKNVVKAWTDEERWYDYNRNRCQPGKQCGHYTQIVWRKTTEVGCALKVCADKSQTWVCSYNPPGNFQGVKPY